MKHLKKTSDTKKIMASCVSFSENEYRRITNKANRLGKSIPSILKKSHFRKKPVTPVFSFDDAKKLISALARIGNNLNQIARKINSGFAEGYNDHLRSVSEEIRVLKTCAVGVRGRSDNKF